MKARASLVLIGCCMASASFAQKFGYPDPEVFAKAAHSLCQEQNASILLAAQMRDQGQSKADALAEIAPKSSVIQLRLLDAYRENIEDVFAFPSVGTYTLTTFRAEVCRREVMAARTFPRFATVREKVEACESQHGKVQGTALYRCIRGVVDGM